MTYLETVSKSVYELMDKYSNTIYLGEDVRNGQRGITENFIKKFGTKRIIDTPISEASFCGFALGLAISGYRPIVEFNFAGLIYVCLDQIYNQAFKFKKMTGNKRDVPIIYLLPTGSKGGLAGHHSDNPYSVMAHLGVETYMPIYQDQIKKIFKKAFDLKKPVAIFLPTEEFRSIRKFKSKFNPNLPLEKIISKKGKNSVAIISTGTSIEKCLKAIDSLDYNLKNKCNLYGLWNFSENVMNDKLIKKINEKKILIVDDSPGKFGISSTLKSLFLRQNINFKYKIEIVDRLDNFIPFNESLENSVRPTVSKIISKIRKLGSL